MQCKGLGKRFGHKVALEGVDLEIPKGRIIGLLGPNGSGKTTLIKLANGLLTPDEGTITVGAVSYTHLDVYKRQDGGHLLGGFLPGRHLGPWQADRAVR